VVLRASRTIVDPEGSGRYATTQTFPPSPDKPGAPRVRRHKPDASGTFTETISSVVVSVTATSETTDNAATFNGQISYQA
jgi:hypothetical protein